MDIDDIAGILHRVLHQIADHIQKQVSISHHPVGSALVIERNIHLLLLILSINCHQILQGGMDIERSNLERDMFLCPDYFPEFGEIGSQVIALLSYGLHDKGILILLICLLSREYGYTHLQRLHGALQLVNHRMHEVASHLIHLLLQEHHLNEISYAQEKQDGNQQTSCNLPNHPLQDGQHRHLHPHLHRLILDRIERHFYQHFVMKQGRRLYDSCLPKAMLARLHLRPDETIAQFSTYETIKMRLVKTGKLVSDISIQAIKRIVGIRLTQIESISLLHHVAESRLATHHSTNDCIRIQWRANRCNGTLVV